MLEKSPSMLMQHYSSSRSVDDSKVSVVWENLSFQRVEKDTKESKPFKPVYKTKQILSNISGKASSGELLAIMGPTGCGKTSLLNILAARVSLSGSTNAALSGSVLINGAQRNDVVFRKISAYVLQDDHLYPHLTVGETLLLAAHFYLSETATVQDKEQLVDAVISELGLIKTRLTIIGDDKLRGISGGERKRTSIAVQLISDPIVLFLDEPTSGLGR